MTLRIITKNTIATIVPPLTPRGGFFNSPGKSSGVYIPSVYLHISGAVANPAQIAL
jgi:hypothetical protein